MPGLGSKSTTLAPAALSHHAQQRPMMPPPMTATSGPEPDIRAGVGIEHDASGPPPLTEGEQWTRGALEKLRARRYIPLAWACFIGASSARSVEDLARRPDLARQAAAVVAAGAVPWVLLGRGRALAWWGAVGGMLLTHAGMVEGPSGERRSGLGVANIVTLGRAWMIPAVVKARDRRTFTALAALVFASDAIDGAIARARTEETRLGAQMDHAVDAALTISVAEVARRRGWLPTWTSALVIGRYAAPVGLLAVYYFSRAEAPPRHRLIPARAAGALVAAGLVGAAAGYRRPATGLVATGVAWGLTLAATSAVRALSGTKRP